MRSFNFLCLQFFILFGVVLLNVCSGQLSEQFAVDVNQTGSDESSVEMLRFSPPSAMCESSMGNRYKCVKLQTKCYCFVNKQLTWDKAQEFCSVNGKRLLSIETQQEQNDVSSVLMPIVLSDPIASKIGVWTSGNYNAGTKTFSWTAQTPFTFVNWFYGEPRNTGQDQQCLHVRIVPQLSASWATLACDQWMPFICQSDLEEEISLVEITAIVSDLKKEIEDLKKILIASTSASSINGIPNSCKDLVDIGHRKSGLYSVMGTKQVETVYCDFTKELNAPDFQKWIGYQDVKSVSTYFYVQRNASFSEVNTPIPFDMQMVNAGEAMNLTSGKFTAPRSGIYYFSFAGLAQFPPAAYGISNYLQVQMLLNGNLIATGQTSQANDIKYSNNLSLVTMQSTLHLEKGDQIWLQIGDTSVAWELFDNANHHSTHFTGFLIEEEIALSL